GFIRAEKECEERLIRISHSFFVLDDYSAFHLLIQTVLLERRKSAKGEYNRTLSPLYFLTGVIPFYKLFISSDLRTSEGLTFNIV
ncbi:MAG: hypothetical protein ACRCYO_09950, partial [Bacteroidia bacterium]